MDLVTLTQQERKTSLLSLSKLDLLGSPQDNETSSLVMMQLPMELQISDLTSGGCYFVAPRASNTSSNTDSDAASRQACLVLESKKQSYSVSRLETSNVLVLVPPVEDTTKAIIPASGSRTSDEPPVAKKPKALRPAACLLPVPARLLQPGAFSGASFLDLQPKRLTLRHLSQLLQPHVLDPYGINCYRKKAVGRSLESLARQLKCSQAEVQDGLQVLRAFPLPSSSLPDTPPTRYGVLGEEALQDAQNALISTLAESPDEFGDYAGQGVDLNQYIAQSLTRLDQYYDDQEHVLRYAVTTLLQGGGETLPLLADSSVGRVWLDVEKIAVWLAHRLFQAQTQPWQESRFTRRWQNELPGVGFDYHTSLDMLRGVAIRVDAASTLSPTQQRQEDDDNVVYWKYFPANKLPRAPAERFQALFELQDQWQADELEPYLQDLLEDKTELLVQYTTTTSVLSTRKGQSAAASPTKVYSKKG